MYNFKKQLKKYKDRVKKWEREIIQKSKYDTEQNTVIKFVIPLLEMLRWSRLYKEMQFEYVVRDRKTKKRSRVDIALYTKDSAKPKTLVEIKPINTNLSKGSQMLTYLRNTDVKYGIYTNGKEIKLIAKRGVRHGFGPRTLFHLRNIDDFIEYNDLLWLFSKPSLKSGKLDNLIELYHTDYGNWKKNNKKRFLKESPEKLPLIYAKIQLKKL